jgi:hypothetical protein
VAAAAAVAGHCTHLMACQALAVTFLLAALSRELASLLLDDDSLPAAMKQRLQPRSDNMLMVVTQIPVTCNTDNCHMDQCNIVTAHLQPLCEHSAPGPVSALHHHHLVAVVGQLARSRQPCSSSTKLIRCLRGFPHKVLLTMQKPQSHQQLPCCCCCCCCW